MLRPHGSEPVLPEDAARVFDAELSAGGHPLVRGDGTPPANVASQSVEVRDPALAEALAPDEARFHLGSVEPAPMLGREVDLEAGPEGSPPKRDMVPDRNNTSFQRHGTLSTKGGR